MRRRGLASTALAFWTLALVLTACHRTPPSPATAQPKAFGATLEEMGGGLQAGFVGTVLDQPLVVQVNDAQGSPVTGALVTFRASGGTILTPSSGLTGDDGQLTVICQLGGAAGRYQIQAATMDKSGKPVTLRLEEIALGYQQNLGRQLSERYCSRCHDPESTAERVSNYDNLTAKPHAFTNGAFLNAISDADLTAITTYGGAARNKSAEMPSYGGTLSKTDIEALVAYIRALASPPYRARGLIYASE
jgi:mono/diheme cytochrome c family protein